MTDPEEVRNKSCWDLLVTVPRADKHTLHGDFNMREEAVYAAWRGLSGPCGTGGSNDNGLLLLRNCAEHCLFSSLSPSAFSYSSGRPGCIPERGAGSCWTMFSSGGKIHITCSWRKPSASPTTRQSAASSTVR
ncbi:hypothetical protein SprV_0301024300 [Sparganum proliferum]